MKILIFKIFNKRKKQRKMYFKINLIVLALALNNALCQAPPRPPPNQAPPSGSMPPPYNPNMALPKGK